MDPIWREVLGEVLSWWVQIVFQTRKFFLSLAICLFFRMRRISVNDDIYFSEIPEEQGPEASSSSKKRRRGSVDRDEKYIEALKDLGKMMDLSINSATNKICDKICASIERNSNDSVLIAQELRKVGGLTALELHRAHAELKSSVLLWMLFKDVPDENKAEFVRELIMT